MTYEIRVQGYLSPQRFCEFEGLTINHRPNGETALCGSFPDQSALFGLLNWLHDLGISLISVRRLEGADHCIFGS
jgi:hypothetical protein